jgi:predicted site-specific integrase-resolvase
MDMYKILDQLRQGARIEDLRLRVTFYARVSSEKDEQLNSLSNQISYYREKIKKRKNFLRMLKLSRM